MRHSNQQLSTITYTTVTVLVAALVLYTSALAHVSEQGFILLLPTDVYITSGAVAVALTAMILILLPARVLNRLLRTQSMATATKRPQLQMFVSILSLCLLLSLLVLGIVGSRDPLQNPLPLFIWTLWWVALVIAQGVIGDIWQWLNPWTGVYRLVRGTDPILIDDLKQPSDTKFAARTSRRQVFPDWLGAWPGVVAFLLFVAFLLSDKAPDDPARLAVVVSVYWLYTFAGMLLFGGECWLARCECFTMLLHRYAQLSPVSVVAGKWCIGMPGWNVRTSNTNSFSHTVFVLLLLGSGSFDGLNETFWWLGKIGINPLAFPGRSAVVWQSTLGLLFANIALVAVFALCVKCGTWLAQRYNYHTVSFHSAFTRLAMSILPIAFAYHFAHYLSVILVNGQYALAAASDPLNQGADLLGLGTFYVTTGFFNTHHTAKIIWMSQAVAVVIGHVISLVLAHAIAVDLFGKSKQASISQLPLTGFMILYTFLGLWLLAAPKGA